jgi:hypothetical protein
MWGGGRLLVAGWATLLFHDVTLCLYSYLAILLVDTSCQHVLSFIFYLYTLQPDLDWSCLEQRSGQEEEQERVTRFA